MPVVPQAQRRVTTQAAPSVFQTQQQISAPREAFGGGEGLVGAGQTLIKAGDVVGDLVLAEKDQEDTNEAKKIELAYATRVRHLLHGTPQDPNSGYYATRGQNAVDGRAGVEEALAKAREEALASASNPNVRQLLEAPTATRQERELTGVARYYTQERRVAWDNVSEARLSNIRSDVAARARNPEADKDINEGLGLIVNEVHDMGVRNGWGQQEIKDRVRAENSLMFVEVIDRHLAEKDARSAHAVFSKYNHLIDGGLHDDIITKMETGLDLQHATEQFDMIVSQTDDFKTQLEMARQIEDPKVRKTTTSMIESNFHNNNRIKEVQSKEVFDRNFASVLAGNPTSEISVEDRVGMSVTQNNFLDAMEKRLSETGSAFAKQTDFAVYNSLNRMSKEEFMQQNLATPEFVNALKEEDWKRMSNRQAQFIKEDANAKSTGSGGTAARTSTQVRNATIKAYNMDEEEQYHFGRQFDEQVAIQEKAKGEKLDAVEAQAISDALTVEFVSDAGFFQRLPRGVQGDEPLFLPTDIEDEPRAVAVAKEIGARVQDMPMIVQILRENQMEITKENMLKVLQAGQ